MRAPLLNAALWRHLRCPRRRGPRISKSLEEFSRELKISCRVRVQDARAKTVFQEAEMKPGSYQNGLISSAVMLSLLLAIARPVTISGTVRVDRSSPVKPFKHPSETLPLTGAPPDKSLRQARAYFEENQGQVDS